MIGECSFQVVNLETQICDDATTKRMSRARISLSRVYLIVFVDRRLHQRYFGGHFAEIHNMIQIAKNASLLM